MKATKVFISRNSEVLSKSRNPSQDGLPSEQLKNSKRHAFHSNPLKIPFKTFCFLSSTHQVNDLTRNLTKLEKELAEKERYVALSQMRLGNRAQRVGIELCKDKAQETLMRELMALKDTHQKLSHMIDQVVPAVLIGKLLAKLSNLLLLILQSKTTLRYLLNTQMLQEEEINLKINSLKIDMDCMTVRESLKFKEF